MADKEDVLGASLSDEDLTFLRHADGFRAPFEKIKEAKRLIAEARAEIRAIVGGQPVGKKTNTKKTKKKGKRTMSVKFSPDDETALTENQSAVLKAVQAGLTSRPAIDERTGLKPHITKEALKTLRKLKLVRLEGKGRGGQWLGNA